MRKGNILNSGKTDNAVKLISHLLICFILCALLLSATGCYVEAYLRNEDVKDKLTEVYENHKLHLSYRDKNKMLVGFNEEQEKMILEAFNVVIPENEEEAYVYSFYFTEENEHLKFILEIDGVKDYDAFFLANSGRVKENGLLGKSMNEVLNPYPSVTAYYITYNEFFSYENNFLSDEDKEMMSVFSTLYDELKNELK